MPNQARVGELYRTYGPLIYARCVRLLRDRARAEDAMQETFIRVLKHIDTAPNDEEVIRWIARISTNYCLNEIRNQKRRGESNSTTEEVEATAHPTNHQRDFQYRDLVYRMLSSMPTKVCVPAWLHHVEGMDQESVARVLDVSRRTVINRLNQFSKASQQFLARTQ